MISHTGVGIHQSALFSAMRYVLLQDWNPWNQAPLKAFLWADRKPDNDTKRENIKVIGRSTDL